MNFLTRTSPKREVGRSVFDEGFDDFFEGFFRPMRWPSVDAEAGFLPATDITEREKDYLVKADLPGIDKKDINVTVDDGVLTISAETKSEGETKEGGKLIRQERRYGKYIRSMQLGQQVDETKVLAHYKDGVLELILPKKEPMVTKKTSVEVK